MSASWYWKLNVCKSAINVEITVQVASFKLCPVTYPEDSNKLIYFVLLVALPKALMYIDLNLLNNHDRVIQSLQFFATWFHSNAVMLACIHGWQNATLKHLHLIPFNNIQNQVACKMIPRGLAINWEEKLGLQRCEDAFSQNQFRSISTSLQLLWPRLWNQWEAAW